MDAFGAPRMTVGGLAGMIVGCASYALFQAANNTLVMAGVARINEA